MIYPNNQQPFAPMVFSPDGATLIATYVNAVRTYAVPSGKLLSEHKAMQWEIDIE